jgi:hypothetical protein
MEPFLCAPDSNVPTHVIARGVDLVTDKLKDFRADSEILDMSERAHNQQRRAGDWQSSELTHLPFPCAQALLGHAIQGSSASRLLCFRACLDSDAPAKPSFADKRSQTELGNEA